MNYEVSVIVPIHGVGKFLGKCLSSLNEQTFKLPYEVICVSDNCNDNSDEIISEYVSKYPNKFKTISVCNKNASETRNDGLKIATGKFILFVDGDDAVREKFIEKLYDLLKDNDSDVGCCNYYFTYEDKDNKKIKGFASLFKIHSKCSPKKARIALYNDVRIRGYVWNKIYRRQFLVENNISFNKRYLPCDDYNFNSICFAKTNKPIRFTTYRANLYLQRKNSYIHGGDATKVAASFLKVYSFLRAYEIYNNVDLNTKSMYFSRKLFIKIDFTKKHKRIENYKETRKEYINKIDSIKNAKDISFFEDEIIEDVKKNSK